MVEVDGFPGVEHDRTRARRLVLAHDGVELAAGDVAAGGGVHGVHRRRAVRLAGREHHLAGQQQLAELEHGPAVGQPLGADAAVAAPRQVGAPHLAPLLPEARRPGPQHRRGLVRRAPAPVLGDERARTERPARRMELAAPAAVVRLQLGGVVGHGEGDVEGVELVLVVAVVGERQLDAPGAAGVEGDARDEAQPGDRVAARDLDAAAALVDVLEREARCPRRAVAAVAGQAGVPRIARCVLGDDPDRRDDVEGADGRRPRRRGGRRGEAVTVERTDGGAPVDHHPAGDGGIDHEAGAVTRDVDEATGGSPHAQPLLAPSVRPLTNWRCRIRYTTSVGMATSTEPAAMRLSLVKNCPPRLASDEVIGRSRALVLQQHGPEEVVVHPRELQRGEGGERRLAQRHGDLPELAQHPGAVDHRRLADLGRQRLHVVAQHERAEAGLEGDVDGDDAERCCRACTRSATGSRAGPSACTSGTAAGRAPAGAAGSRR